MFYRHYFAGMFGVKEGGISGPELENKMLISNPAFNKLDKRVRNPGYRISVFIYWRFTLPGIKPANFC